MQAQLLLRLPARYRRPEVLTAGTVLVALAITEIGVATGYINPIMLRRPTEVFGMMVTSIQTPEMQHDLFVTAQRVAITFLLSAVIGGALSVVFWRYDLLRRSYIPLLGAIFGTPIVLLYLVFVVVFGRGTLAIVAISVPIGVIPIAINATDALASVEEIYVDIARTFNADSVQMMTKVIVPDAAPDIFAGGRIGFSYVVTSVTAVEFLLVVDSGLGGRISDAYFRFNTTEMFVGITLVVVVVVVAIFLLRRAEAMIRR